MQWDPKQLALAVYAHLYGIEDLGLPLVEVLHLAGLGRGQWETRVTMDLPAQDGTSRFMPRIESWYDKYTEFKSMPRADLREKCVRYLERMRVRKGLAAPEVSPPKDLD